MKSVLVLSLLVLCLIALAAGHLVASTLVKGPCGNGICAWSCVEGPKTDEWWASSDTTVALKCFGISSPTCDPAAGSVNCTYTVYNNSECKSVLPGGDTGIKRTGTQKVDVCK